MRAVAPLILLLARSIPVLGDRPKFEEAVKASLVFEDDFDATRRYPHILRVFLRLENIDTSDVSWMVGSSQDLTAELLDAAGKQVRQPPAAASISGAVRRFVLPYGSRLDWLVSHGGVSMAEDTTNKYALVIGGRGWLIPIDEVASYSLRVRLTGQRGTGAWSSGKLGKSELLLDLPAQRIEVSK